MPLSRTDWEALESILTKDRLEVYLILADGDKDVAVELFELDMLVAADLLVPLHVLELTLRNVVHSKLSNERRSEAWFEDAGFVWRKYEKNALGRAARVVKEPWYPDDTLDGLIGQMSFGFWVRCFSRNTKTRYGILI